MLNNFLDWNHANFYNLLELENDLGEVETSFCFKS